MHTNNKNTLIVFTSKSELSNLVKILQRYNKDVEMSRNANRTKVYRTSKKLLNGITADNTNGAIYI